MSSKLPSMVDPIYGVMSFSNNEKMLLKYIVDQPSFQRLRRIKQLALGDYVFPGAVHSRFNHCIGTWYICNKICHVLRNDIKKEHKIHACLAALLHDIGHGPFSHAFEEIYDKGKTVKHEDWTFYFLEKIRNDLSTDQLNKIQDKFGFNLDFDYVNYLITGQPNTKENTESVLLKQLVASQLDSDRLDYLRRDSHFCGVSYGHFDIEWLINSLMIKKNFRKKYILVHHKGIGCIEQYLMARRLMNKNVYLNPKKCAAEFLIEQFLRVLSQNDIYWELLPEHLSEFLNKMKTYCLEKSDKTTFLKEAFINYCNLVDDDIFTAVKKIIQKINKSIDLSILANDITCHLLPRVYYIHPFHSQPAIDYIENHIKQYKYNDWELKLHKPDFTMYKYETHNPIQIYYDNNHWHRLTDDSMIMNFMADKIEQIKFLIIHKSILDKSSKKYVYTNELLKKLKRMHAIIEGLDEN